MQNLETIVDSIVEYLEEIDRAREKVISLVRKLNRESGRGIAKIIRGQTDIDAINLCRKLVVEINEEMRSVSNELGWKLTNSGFEEYVEFEILFSIVTNSAIPSPSDLAIPKSVWLTALGDVPGELRRLCLNHLLIKKYTVAEKYLNHIQDIFQLITGLDFSKSLVPNLRRKVDSARVTVERTESDFLNSSLIRK